MAVDCLRREAGQGAPRDDPTQPPDSLSPTSSTLSDAENLFSTLINNSDAHTVITSDLISEYEMNFYYHGISRNPPKLLWRSNLESDPFPIPPPGTDFHKIPQKTVHGVFNTLLNELWDDTVVPKIKVSLKNRDLKYSMIGAARFSIVKDGGEETFGPIVIWIAVRPKTTNASAVRDATPDILNILTASQITGVVVEWFEGEVVRLIG